MAALVSAGLLCYRFGAAGELEVLLAHPGGPFFARKDAGSWGIPKGLVEDGEDLFSAACREFAEELGWPVRRDAEFLPLEFIRMKSGKTVHAWAFTDPAITASPVRAGISTFTLEWPRNSGRLQVFPEIDRAEFFPLNVAAEKILPAQQPFLDRLRSRKASVLPDASA